MLWAAAAVLGIVATATVAWAASRLAAPGIGLSSEPPSVVSGLAPAGAAAGTHRHARATAARHPKPRARPANPAAPTAPPSASPPASAATSPGASVATPRLSGPAATTPASTARASSTPAFTGNSQPGSVHRQTATHRDDSSGGGSGDSRAKRDD